MRILLVSSIFPPEIGGPATYVANLARAFEERGFLVKVLANERWFSLLWLILKEGRSFDIFYANGGLSATLPALIAARILRKRIGVKITGDYAWETAMNRGWINEDIDDFQNKKFGIGMEILKKCRSLIPALSDFVIVPSYYLKKMVVNWGVDEKKVSVIYNAVEILATNLQKSYECYKSYENHESCENFKYILSVGRLVPWKGFDYLIKAFGNIYPNLPRIRLVIIGDGPCYDELKSLANNNSAKEAIILTGRLSRQEIFDWYRRAFCFVLFSGYEGLSHVLLEALSFNLPVIASAKGGNPELIRDGVNGLLIPYGDQPALESNLKVFFKKNSQPIKNPGLLNKENFFWSTLVEKTILAIAGRQTI